MAATWGLVMLLVAGGSATGAVTEPVEVTLAEGGEAALAVVVAEAASEREREAAATLAAYLERISGAPFEVAVGDGASGIVVGKPSGFDALPFAPDLPDDALGREDYVLRSGDGALWLTGATDLAVEHAVWDLLHRLGYRQYFPGETWEIVPERETLAIAVDAAERPDFHARRIWYNWGLWGYNEEPYRQWSDRNRAVQGFVLNSGHVYESLLATYRETFDENPEFYARIEGEREYRGGGTKFCIGNPALRELIVDHAVRQVESNPDLDSLSMDPSDGGGWCVDCELCAEIGSGGVSDRALTLANEVATAINGLDHGEKYVGMLAYNRHAPPPTIDVHPNVIITATTHFVRDGYTLDEIMEGWAARGATLGVYDYFSVIAWDWNLPRMPSGEVGKAVRPHVLARQIPRYHEQGARFFDAESGDAWGAYGLSYYVAGRIMWDLDEAERVDQIIDEFLDDCFGPAREPMAAFYHLIAIEDERRPLADVLARMYRHLAEARELAADDPDVRKRIDHLILYTRYAELYKAFADATGDAEAEARRAVLAHGYRMRETMMVHSLGLWRRLSNQVEGDLESLEDDRPFTEADLAQIVAEGTTAHPLMEPPTFTAATYSEQLVPAADRLGLAEVAEPGSHPPDSQDLQNYFLWFEPDEQADAPSELRLAVTVEEKWNKRPHHLRLLPPEQAPFGDVDEQALIYCKFGCCAMAMHIEPEPVDQASHVRPDGQTYDVTLATPFAGLHRLEVVDGGDYTRIAWPDDVRVTLPTGERTPGVMNHFRGPWSLYFYVPKGTTVVGGWASRIAYAAPVEPGVVRNGDGEVVYDFAEHEDGYFTIPVPEGQDGRLWQFHENEGQRLLMTVPPYLARTANDLLLPAEVVEADAP